MMNTITVEETAAALKISTADALELLLKNNIVPMNGVIALAQAERFLAAMENSEQLSEKRAKENLERVVGRYTLMADTCALLHAQFPALFTRLLPLLRANGKALLIPTSVEAELKHLFLRKSELREQISRLITMLEAGIAEGTVKLCGAPTDSFGDQQLLALAVELRTRTELLVLTHDKALSEDLLRMNSTDSVQGSPFAISRISPYGYLSRYSSRFCPDSQCA